MKRESKGPTSTKTAAKDRTPAKTAARPTEPAVLIAEARAMAFTETRPERAFAHFKPLAEAVDPEGLAVFTGQPLVMRANVQNALAALEPHLPAAVARLSDPHLREVFELPALVAALGFAVGRVPAAKLSAGEIERLLAEASPWRALTLKYLEVVSDPLLNLVPQERVATIRAGNGSLDRAQDCVAIPGVFAEFADALAGKHPFTPEQLERLATIGAVLVEQMRPRNAPAAPTKRAPEAVLRDQLAALVEDRYDHLQVLATAALGRRRADALVPALRASVATGGGGAVEAPAPMPVEDEKKPDAPSA